MFVTTDGVVLKSYPFKDGSYIVKIFTSENGLLSFIVKKTKKKSIIYQPLTILEITYRKKENSSLFYIKDAHMLYAYQNLLFNSEKIQIAIVLSEILQKCLGEPNTALYNFIVDSFKWLDLANQNYSGFSNLFLIKFCEIAGLSPYEALDFKECPNQQLDLKQGLFISSNVHSNELQKPEHIVPVKESLEIFKLSQLNFEDLKARTNPKTLNDSVFNYLLKYISIHLTDLQAIKSIKILKEIF